MNTLAEASLVRETFDYDSDTGALRWKATTSRRFRVGDIATAKDKEGYLIVKFNGRLRMQHRLIWLLTHGTWPSGVIDHINGSKTDNRLSNLRDVSVKMNTQNMRKPYKGSLSGYLGVSPLKGRWQANIYVKGRHMHLGIFDDPERAHEAYVTAKRQHHPGSTL